MVVRRLLGVLGILALVLVTGALPAQAGEHGDHHDGDHHPSYPPKSPSISISSTRVVLGGSAVVTATGCKAGSTATVTVTAPGHRVTQTLQVNADGSGKVTATVTFTRLGANLVTVSCPDPFSRPLVQSVKVNVVPRCAIWADHEAVNEHGHVVVSVDGHERGSRTTFDVLAGDRVVYSAAALTNAAGVATAVLPLGASGGYTVRVVGVSTDGPVTQTLPVTVLAGHTESSVLPISLGGMGLGLLLLVGTTLALTGHRRRPGTHARP